MILIARWKAYLLPYAFLEWVGTLGIKEGLFFVGTDIFNVDPCAILNMFLYRAQATNHCKQVFQEIWMNSTEQYWHWKLAYAVNFIWEKMINKPNQILLPLIQIKFSNNSPEIHSVTPNVHHCNQIFCLVLKCIRSPKMKGRTRADVNGHVCWRSAL